MYDKGSEGIELIIKNDGPDEVNLSIHEAYSGKTQTQTLHPHQSTGYVAKLQKTFGWYDLNIAVDSDPAFQRRLAGHVETGAPSVTDPAIAWAV